MTTSAITQTFIPGPRLIDGTDLNNLVAQANAAFAQTGTFPSITALNTVGAGTITAAGIVSTITSRGGAQAGAAFTDTTDTAANIIAALPTAAVVGTSFIWAYENTTDGAATLAAGTNVTLAGNVIIPKLTWAAYLVTKTAATTVSITYLYGSGMSSVPATKLFTETSLSTVTVAGITGAQHCTLSLGAGMSVMVMPAATDLIAATPNARIGASWDLTIRNPQATATVQITGLTGTTLTTIQLQGQKAATFDVNIQSAGSVQITGLTNSSIQTA